MVEIYFFFLKKKLSSFWYSSKYSKSFFKRFRLKNVSWNAHILFNDVCFSAQLSHNLYTVLTVDNTVSVVIHCNGWKKSTIFTIFSHCNIGIQYVSFKYQNYLWQIIQRWSVSKRKHEKHKVLLYWQILVLN